MKKPLKPLLWILILAMSISMIMVFSSAGCGRVEEIVKKLRKSISVVNDKNENLSKGPPQIILSSESVEILPKLGNFKWILEDNTTIEEKNFDMLKYGNEMKPIEVAPDEEITVNCNIEMGQISLYMIIDGRPDLQKSYPDEFSFFPPNDVGTYIFYITCSWGKEINASYIFKLEVNEQIKLTSDIKEIIDEFKTLGLDIEIRKITDEDLLVNPIMITIGEEQINIYKYESKSDVEYQKTLIDSGGCSINGTEIEWVSVPHFYAKDDLIAFYCGENEDILKILNKIFDEQFAGH